MNLIIYPRHLKAQDHLMALRGSNPGAVLAVNRSEMSFTTSDRVMWLQRRIELNRRDDLYRLRGTQFDRVVLHWSCADFWSWNWAIEVMQILLHSYPNIEELIESRSNEWPLATRPARKP